MNEFQERAIAWIFILGCLLGLILLYEAYEARSPKKFVVSGAILLASGIGVMVTTGDGC